MIWKFRSTYKHFLVIKVITNKVFLSPPHFKQLPSYSQRLFKLKTSKIILNVDFKLDYFQKATPITISTQSIILTKGVPECSSLFCWNQAGFLQRWKNSQTRQQQKPNSNQNLHKKSRKTDKKPFAPFNFSLFFSRAIFAFWPLPPPIFFFVTLY